MLLWTFIYKKKICEKNREKKVDFLWPFYHIITISFL